MDKKAEIAPYIGVRNDPYLSLNAMNCFTFRDKKASFRTSLLGLSKKGSNLGQNLTEMGTNTQNHTVGVGNFLYQTQVADEVLY